MHLQVCFFVYFLAHVFVIPFFFLLFFSVYLFSTMCLKKKKKFFCYMLGQGGHYLASKTRCVHSNWLTHHAKEIYCYWIGFNMIIPLCHYYHNTCCSYFLHDGDKGQVRLTGCVASRNRSLKRCYTEAPLSLLRVSRSNVCTGPFVCPPFIPYSNSTSKMTLPSYQITQSVPLQNLPGLFDRQVYEGKPLALAHTASNSYFGIATHKINQENFTVEGCFFLFLFLVLKIL